MSAMTDEQLSGRFVLAHMVRDDVLAGDLRTIVERIEAEAAHRALAEARVAALPVLDEAILQAVNLGALIRTDSRLKGTPMALEVKLRELRAILGASDGEAG